MTVKHKIQGISFYISTPVEVIATPTKQQVLNQLDYIGEGESLLRIKDESNAEYKQRILDLSVHPGGPTYEGIVNNLSRAFGYPREQCLTIDLVTDIDGNYIATSPRVDFLADKVILYSDWRPNGIEVIDKEINIYNPNDAGYYISDLVNEINSSTFFTATLETEIRPNMFSTNIIRDSSSRSVQNDIIKDAQRTVLSAEKITKDSLVFSEKDIFKTEVLSTPTSIGEYLVDYQNGVIESYSVPLGIKDVSYYYCKFPMILDYSLVKIYTLQDNNFYNQLFDKETLNSGDEINKILNVEGAEIFNELYNDINVFWGE